MSTHIGKIGRLSKNRREELGERIEDGQTGRELAEWLNGLPDVQAVLKKKFGGLPINEQNVTNWRQSGHLDWLRLREGRARVLRLVSDAGELSAVAKGHRLGDCLATLLAVEMDNLGRALLGDEEADLEKRWKRFCEVHRQVSRLRRDDDRVKRTRLREERWDWEKSEAKNLESQVENGEGEEREAQRPMVQVHNLEAEVARLNRDEEEQGDDRQDTKNQEDEDDGCELMEDDDQLSVEGLEGAEKAANQDKSRQIKVENEGKEGQSSMAEIQGLGAKTTGLDGHGEEDGQGNHWQGNGGNKQQSEDERRLEEENRLWRVKAGFEELTEKV